MTICVVSCCRSSLDPNRTYHKFPTDPARSKEWLKILGKKSTDIKTKSVICSRHFRFKDYYSGGKRLLPSAVPLLRLNSSPKKEKPTGLPSKTRKSEPNRPKYVITQSPKKLRKSVPNTILNPFKDGKQPHKLQKNTSKLKVALDPSRSKQVVKTVTNVKCEKQEKENALKFDLVKAINKKNLRGDKKSLSKLRKRSPLSVRKITINQSRNRLLRNNYKKSPLKAKDIKKHTESKTIKRRDCLVSKVECPSTSSNQSKKDSSVSIVKKHSNNLISQIKGKYQRIVNTTKGGEIPLNLEGYKCVAKEQTPKVEGNKGVAKVQIPSKVEGNEFVAKSKKSPVSKINIIKSSSDNPSNESKTKSLEEFSTSDKRTLETSKLESGTRRPVKKRKRLLSEEGSENNYSRPKIQKSICKSNVQKFKNCSGALRKEPQQAPTSQFRSNTSSKNLSGIEKTILEMQNKIQMLEKKAILDEMKIDTFKKALITQRNTDLQILMDERENELLLRMDLLYLDYDPQRICRLCLQLVDKKEDIIPLFWPLRNQALLSLIKQATNVEIEPEDGMPSSICGECLEDIRRVDWLKRRTQKSNTLIKKFVTLKKSSAQSNVVPQVSRDMKQKSLETVNEEETTDEFKIEDVFSLENSPMSLFENVTIKQEQESDEESTSVNELNATYSLTGRPQKSQRCGNCSRTFKDLWIFTVHSQYCYKRFQCSECNKCFLNARLFRRHKQMRYSCYCAEHLRACSDCDISFRWKWQLVFHVLRHSTQVCVFCNDTVHSNEHLQKHMKEAHANSSNLNFSQFSFMF